MTKPKPKDDACLHCRIWSAINQFCKEYPGENEIFVRSCHGIRACEVLFACFEDLEAFGTLVETGMAHALGKRIVVGFCEPPHGSGRYVHDEEIDSYAAFFRCDTVEQLRQLAASMPSCHLSNDLWFAAQCAEEIFRSDTVDELLRQFSDWLKTEYGNL